MIDPQTKQIKPNDTILMATFGYAPHIKKDSREKIIKALDDLAEEESKIRSI